MLWAVNWPDCESDTGNQSLDKIDVPQIVSRRSHMWCDLSATSQMGGVLSGWPVQHVAISSPSKTYYSLLCFQSIMVHVVPFPLWWWLLELVAGIWMVQVLATAWSPCIFTEKWSLTETTSVSDADHSICGCGVVPQFAAKLKWEASIAFLFHVTPATLLNMQFFCVWKVRSLRPLPS